MSIREIMKQAARQVIEKLSNIALAVKLHLGATPEAARPQMAMAAAAAPGFGLGGGSSTRPGAVRRRQRHDDK